MGLSSCPDCGQTISDLAPACIYCGRPRVPNPSLPAGAPDDPEAPPPLPDAVASDVASTTTTMPSITPKPQLFPVAPHKFLVMSLSTLGIYELYWFYKNWQRIKESTGESLSPFWRAFFGPLWGFSLFGRIRMLATTRGVQVGWSSGFLATCYLILSVCWRLPDPWWLVTYLGVFPILPVVHTVQEVNDASFSLESRNGSYTASNVTAIVLGGLILLLGIAGTLMPE